MALPPKHATILLAVPIWPRTWAYVWWDNSWYTIRTCNPPADPPVNYTPVSFWRGYFKGKD